MDSDIEKRLEIMRNLRIQATIRMINDKIGDIKKGIEYDEFSKNNKVIDIKYIGQIQLNGSIQDIYLIVEQQQVLDEKGNICIIEMESYVTQDFEKIAGNNKSDNYNFAMVTEKYVKQKAEIEKQLQALDKEGIVALSKIEESRLQLIAKAMGITVDEIETVDEIDLEQEVSTKIEDSSNSEEDKEQEEDKKQDTEQISKKQMQTVQTKEETRINQYLKGQTLENKLALREHGITDGVKLARVTSSSINPYMDKKVTQVDAFVIICKSGEAVVLGEDILEPDNRLGTNSYKTATTINNDGTVREEVITSSYKIKNGKNNEYLQISNDEASGKEIKYGMYSSQEGEYVNVELETQRTMPQNSDVRRFINDKGAGKREAQNILERNRMHGECNEKDVTVIDNDKTNNSHVHTQEIENIDEQEYVPNTNIKWKDFATQCGYRGTDWKERIYKKWNEEKMKTENIEKDNNQLVQDIQDEMNEQYIMRNR